MLLLTFLGVQGLVEKGPVIIAIWALVGLNILFWAFLFFLAFFEWVMNPSREGWKKIAFDLLKSSLTFAGVLGLFAAVQLLANKWGTELEKQGRMTPCQRSAEVLEDSLKPTLLERLKGHPTVQEKQKLSNALRDYLQKCEQRQAEERAKLTPEEKEFIDQSGD